MNTRHCIVAASIQSRDSIMNNICLVITLKLLMGASISFEIFVLGGGGRYLPLPLREHKIRSKSVKLYGLREHIWGWKAYLREHTQEKLTKSIPCTPNPTIYPTYGKSPPPPPAPSPGCTWMYVDVRGCTWMYVDVRGCTWVYLGVLPSHVTCAIMYLCHSRLNGSPKDVDLPISGIGNRNKTN